MRMRAMVVGVDSGSGSFLGLGAGPRRCGWRLCALCLIRRAVIRSPSSPRPQHPSRARPVDVSVLVQDASTGEPLPVARVTIRVSKLGGRAFEFQATSAAATNKLYRAAQFELPKPGRWDVQVRVQGSQQTALIDTELDAAAPVPRWHELWPWIGWPVLAIALFGIHQVLERRANIIEASRVATAEPPTRATLLDDSESHT